MLLPPLQQVLYPLGEQVATAEDAQLSLRSGQQGGLIGLVSGQPDVTTSSGALPTTVEPLELAATKGSGVPAGTMIKSPDYEGEVTRIGVVETYMGEYDYQRLDDMIHVRLHGKRPWAKQASAMLLDPKKLIPGMMMPHPDIGI